MPQKFSRKKCIKCKYHRYRFDCDIQWSHHSCVLLGRNGLDFEDMQQHCNLRFFEEREKKHVCNREYITEHNKIIY